MEFKAKVFKLGSGFAMYIPKSIYIQLKLGEIYIVDIKEKDIIKESKVVIPIEEVKEKPIPLKEKEPIPFYCQKKHKGKSVCAKYCGCY